VIRDLPLVKKGGTDQLRFGKANPNVEDGETGEIKKTRRVSED